MFVQKSGNAQIIDVGDVKTAKMLFELLIAKKLVNLLTIFRTINRLISRYFFAALCATYDKIAGLTSVDRRPLLRACYCNTH